MEKYALKVYRFDPLRDTKPFYQDYEIPFSASMSLLMALEYIYEKMDETLAFRRYCCGTSRCSSCLMEANGRKVRACSTLVERGKPTVVEPLKGYQVIKDLVVDFGAKEEEEDG